MKIRSKTFVLIYKKSLNKKLLIDFLRERIEIKNDNDWNYVVKLEHYLNGKTHTIVYCDIASKPYLPVSKVTFYSDEGIFKPEVYVWNSSHLLQYVLTFCGAFDFEKISTNYSKETILENVKELKHEETHVIENASEIETTLETQTNSIKGSVNPMGEKQIILFMKHYEALVTLSQSEKDENTINLMSRKLNNMLNFKNKHDLTEGQMELIAEARTLIRKIKDKQTTTSNEHDVVTHT